MGGHTKKVFERIVEALARFWPMSKTEDAVLDDLRSVYAEDERPGRTAQSS